MSLWRATKGLFEVGEGILTSNLSTVGSGVWKTGEGVVGFGINVVLGDVVRAFWDGEDDDQS